MMRHNILAFSISLILGSQAANANPTGAQVVHGSATFNNPTANVLNVHNSHNAVINWQSFNIGAGQTTNFFQPSSASSVLNRVVSNNPSQLLGNLNSNGKVFLINQHGILVGAGAQINTSGFFGSTLNITDSDFLNGNLKFEGGGNGDINNQGYIHAADHGNIVLIAPNIENGGVIEVDDGNVILAAGKSITISSLENPAIQFEVSGNEHTVTNLGQILAHKGSASLFAGSLKHSGSIRAGGIRQNADGSISLVAKQDVQVSGVVDVSGTKGGYVEILGETVTIDDGALVNASGDQAGGEILIGGDQQGLNPEIQNARSTTIAQGAKVNADALQNGNGGKVIVFAEEDVHVHGEVTARGGAVSGDGGFIETSGLKQLDITSVPDATAVNGQGGEWLIDPNNITIINGTGVNISGVPNFVSTDDSAILDVNLVTFALDNGQDVTISTTDSDADNSSGGVGTEAGNITILTNIQKTAGGNASLTLNAHNNILVDGGGSGIDISSTSGVMDVIFNADSDADGSGQIEFFTGTGNSFPITLNTNGGTFTTNADVVINGDVINRSSNVSIINTQWAMNPNTSLDINEDLILDAPGSVVQLDGDVFINNSATFDLSLDSLNLLPGNVLSGFGTLVGDLDINGGVIFGGDGFDGLGTLNINGDLVMNSGALYTIIDAPDGLGSNFVSANTVRINGGDLIVNWRDEFVPGNANNGDSLGVIGCIGTGCFDLAGSGFDTIVDPITVTSGAVDYGQINFDQASYVINTIDLSNIVLWTGASSNDWFDAGNWNTGATPVASSDVFIPYGSGATIDISGAASVNGLQSHGVININAGGNLEINGNAFIVDGSSFDGVLDFQAADATLSGPGVLYMLGTTLKLDQGILAADAVNYGSILTSVGTPFQIDSNLVNNALFALDANSGVNVFSGTGSISNNGIMSWANGAQLALQDDVTLSVSSTNAQFQGNGLLSLDNNAEFAIDNTPDLYDSSILWEINSGTVSNVHNLNTLPDIIDWYSGTISGLSGSDFTLSGGQVLNLFGAGDMFFSGDMTLDNSGIVNFFSSGGDFVFSGNFDNFGQLILNHTSDNADFTGTGVLNNSGTGIDQLSSNDFNLALDLNSDADINIMNGNFIIEGVSDFQSGTLLIDNPAIVSVENGGSLTLGSVFSGITGGGQLDINLGGLFNFDVGPKDLSGLQALNINGGIVQNIQDVILPDVINLSGATATLEGGGNFVIPSTAVMTVDGGNLIGLDSTINRLLIDNQGSINVLSGQSLTLVDASLTNSSGSLTGAGQVLLSLFADLIADANVDIARITLAGGTLTANNLIYDGEIDWSFGTIDGSGLTTTGIVNVFSGVLNTDWTISPTGQVNWTGSDLAVLTINDATITNQGTFNVTSYLDSAQIRDASKDFSSSTNAAFINQGILVIDSNAFPALGGEDVVVFNLTFDNVGGTIAIRSGTFRIENDSGVVQDLVLDAGESLQGFGTFDGNVQNLGGVVTPGRLDLANSNFQTGTLTISGDLIQQTNGELVIKLDSTASGLVHDTLNVDGTLNAGGNVRFSVINGNTPVQIAALLDQSFMPLSVGNFAGRFDSVAIPNGLNFSFSDTGEINITSDNQTLNNIANQLEVLFEDDDLNHQQMVRAMRFIDRKIELASSDEEDEEERRAPRLVCR